MDKYELRDKCWTPSRATVCIMEEKHRWLHRFKFNITNKKKTFMILSSIEGWFNY